MSRTNPIPRIDTCFFNIHANIVLPSTPRPNGLFPAGVPVKILKALLSFFHSGYMTHPSQFSRLNTSNIHIRHICVTFDVNNGTLTAI